MRELPTLLTLVAKSLANRAGTALLTILSIAISVALLASVERLRTDAQSSFANTISGTDLIIGARSGDLNLLLYSVFRLGTPTNNIDWRSYERIATRKEVAWTIPISLGDAHRGFRVLGTNESYFEHYRYADKRPLALADGRVFSADTDAVIGADVAEKLGYTVGQQIVISHGITETSFVAHDDNPFRVTGILARTGTPVDRTVHISLRGMELIHADGRPLPPADEFAPSSITAMIVGLKSRIAVFTLQRFINEFEDEALSAIIPGVALQQLWELIGVAEYALFGVSAMVILAGALGLLTTLLVSLNERRREMAVLRSVGASPPDVFALLVTEAALLGLAGAALGLLLVQAAMLAGRDTLLDAFGIQVNIGLRPFDGYVVLGIITLSIAVSSIPAWRAYRLSLADGFTVRL
jgi:putative ABC transport system permease protein